MRNGSKTVCDPVCTPECQNGTCVEPNKCECFDGYQLSESSKKWYLCQPVCSLSCVNSTCTGINVCTCKDGYERVPQKPNVCVPTCKKPCQNGSCTFVNTCTCWEGYKMAKDKDKWYVSSSPLVICLHYIVLVICFIAVYFQPFVPYFTASKSILTFNPYTLLTGSFSVLSKIELIFLGMNASLTAKPPARTLTVQLLTYVPANTATNLQSLKAQFVSQSAFHPVYTVPVLNRTSALAKKGTGNIPKSPLDVCQDVLAVA